MVLMHDVAFKAWLCGALEFSKVPAARTQAPEVPVCGWWAKGNADGVLGANNCCWLMPCLPGWALGTNKVVQPCPCYLEHQMLSLKAPKQVLSREWPTSVCLAS